MAVKYSDRQNLTLERFGSSYAWILAVLLIIIFAHPAIAQKSNKKNKVISSKATVDKFLTVPEFFAVRLINSHLIGVHHANISGNYTVLRDLGTFQFRQKNTAAVLTDRFKVLRDNKLDLSVVASNKPVFTAPLKIENGVLLHVKGYYPTKPVLLTFDVVFRNELSSWRLHNVALGTAKASAIATGSIKRGKSKRRKNKR